MSQSDDLANGTIVCRGSLALGTGCRKCKRCREEAEKIQAQSDKQTPEQLAERYIQAIDLCCGTSDILIAAEKAFLAGYKTSEANKLESLRAKLQVAREALERLGQQAFQRSNLKGTGEWSFSISGDDWEFAREALKEIE